MGVLEELQNEGWYISEEGLKLLSDDGKVTNPKILIKKALDVDLREIAAPGFPEEVGRCKVEGIPGGLIVQLQKVRNVSAPKANEESGAAPRMLKITLTDGHSTCHAIEIERIPQLTLNTPPGTKILLKPQPEGENIPVVNNYLLLTPKHAEIIGGRVIQMVEKWELNRSLAKHKRTTGGDGGPPPWIPFGQKILRSNPHDKHFKSLQDKDKQNLDSLNPEFEAQRKDAIAEAGRAGAKKVFGGGNRVLLDHNVQQIVEAGFTVEQAEAALKSCNNNVDRALKSLLKNNESTKGADNKRSEKDGGETRTREGGRGKGSNREGGRGRGHGDEDVGTGPKPSGKVSLFEFFTDKLPFDDKDKSQGGPPRGADRGGGSRGGGGGQKGGGNSRGGRAPEREPRGQHADRGGGGGGRGGGGRGRGGGGEKKQGGPDRQPRERREPAERRGKREDNQNTRSSNSKTSGDRKPPRFTNPRNQLQHESAKYVGHTPSSAVSTNSSLGQGGSDWGSALAGRVGMMSLLDCESTPENDMLFGNSTWSNSIRADEDFQPYGQQHQGQGRPRDGGRNVNPGNKGPRSFDQLHRQTDFNNQFENGVMEGFGSGGQQPMQGRPRNAFSNNFMPNIPAFPFNDNGNPALTQMSNHGISGRSNNQRSGPNTGHFDSVGGGRNPANSDRGVGCSQSWPWRQGDKCMAKYWEDERYYNAEVTGVSDKTCVVRFIEYGNHEEVLKDDCIPITEDGISVGLNNGNPALHMGTLNPMNRVHPGNPVPAKPMMPMNSVNSHVPAPDMGAAPFQGIVEYRRGGNRPYVKQPGNENVNSIGRERKPQRAQQSMYVPPAQRK